MNGFSDPIIGGATKLIRKAVQSPNFISGVSGWTINKDGTVEFNNGVFRGNLQAGTLTKTSIANSDFGNGTIHDSTITRTIFTMDSSGGQLLIYANVVVTQVLTASGNINVPVGITSLQRLQAWGSGAIGTANAQGGRGGGSGAYSEETNVAVTASTAYPATIAAGVATNIALNTVTVIANSAVGINGGAISGNTIAFPGANGGVGQGNSFPQSKFSGGGAGSAGPGGQGNTGSNGSISGNGTGGLAVTGGGAGTNGNNGGNSGNAGNPGAGSGGTANGFTPGTAGTGKIIATWLTSQTLIGSYAGVAGTDGIGNTVRQGLFSSQTVIGNVATPAADATGVQLYGASGQLATVDPAGEQMNVSGSQLAVVTLNTVTATALTNLASGVIKGNAPAVGSVWAIDAFGDGTFGTTQASNDLQFQISLGAAPVSLGTFTVGHTFTAISTGFRWKIRAEAVCITIGATGTWLGNISGDISVTGANLLPAVGANASMGAVAGIVNATTLDTTINNTLSIMAAWAATLGAPVINCRYQYFRRVA